MNILFYLFNGFTSFILINQKKLLIFIPFILGILFALFYVWHIHDYHFVFPYSTLLFFLSSLSFLTSILIVLKYAHDAKILKKIIQGILIICLIIFLGYLLSELKILEHKVLRFRLIKILTLILFVVNTVVILFENTVIPKSYQYAKEHKLEILMYIICLLPFLTYASIIYPGATQINDTTRSFECATGGFEAVIDMQPTLIMFMMRLSLALQLPAISLLYIINVVGIIYSSIIISRISKKGILHYMLLILMYISIVLLCGCCLVPKDAFSTISIMCAVSILIYSIFCKLNYNFYLGVIYLIVASLIRYNQITQTSILIIPFIILHAYYKNTSVKSSLKIIIIFLIFIVSIHKGILDNRAFISQLHPISWIQTSDIKYIMLDQKKSCKEYRVFDPRMNCKRYNNFLNTFQRINNPLKIAHFIFDMPFRYKYVPTLWIKMIIKYPGSWILFHSTVTLPNFLKGSAYRIHFSYKQDFFDTMKMWYRHTLQIKQKYNYSIGYVKFKQGGKIDTFLKNFNISILFKYKLYLMIFIVIITFIINRFKILPTMMNDDLKYTGTAYYLSLSCITLFIPLVILVPTGWETRYLAGVDFPLMVSIVLVLIYLYKKYKRINRSIGQNMENPK